MSDLGGAVKYLVEIATKGGKKEQRDLGPAVHAVIEAFDAEDTRSTRAALRDIGGAVARSEGRAEQVLLLALGAMVEAGAPPELAWPAVVDGLKDTLDAATRYAQACLDESEQPHIDEGIRVAKHIVTKKMPRESAAWDALGSRCLAAVACLSRSSKLRKQARATSELIDAAYPLEDAVEEVTFLRQVIRVLDDEPVLVIHPAQRRGYRLVMRDIATNLELFVLITDMLVGDPKKGLIDGKRPEVRAVNVLKDPNASPKKPPTLHVHWNLLAWTGVQPDGSIPDVKTQQTDHWVWLEQVPSEIPVFEGERVIIFQPPFMKRTVEVEPAFAALAPAVQLKGKLSGPEVDRLLAKMGTAAAKLAAKGGSVRRSSLPALTPAPAPAPAKAAKGVTAATAKKSSASKAAPRKAAAKTAASKAPGKTAAKKPMAARKR